MIKTTKKLLFKIWYYFFPNMMIREINNKLADGIIEDHQINTTKATELLFEMREYMFDEYKIHEVSKFIPLKLRFRIVTDMQAKYGEQMKDCGLKITNNLQFKRA